MTPTDSISYGDVAAQTSTFFRDLSGDKVIDPAEKARLATSFFTDVSQIRKVREQNAMVPLRMERERLALDEARFSMDRARKAAEQEDSFTALNSEVDGVLEGIMSDDVLTPEEKVQEIRRAEFEAQRRVPPSMSGGSSWLSRRFGSATKAVLPSAGSDLTPAQTIGLFQAGVPQEIIESGDPILIGRAAAEIELKKKDEAERVKQLAGIDKEERAKAAAYESALNSLSNVDYAIDPTNLDASGNPVVDKTRFKGGDMTAAKIKRILSQSPDPELQKAAASDDVPTLRAAALKAVALTSTTPTQTWVPPARP